MNRLSFVLVAVPGVAGVAAERDLAVPTAGP